MSANAEGFSTIAEQHRLRRPRRNKDPVSETDLYPPPPPSLSPPPPSIPSILQSARCKASVSTLLLSTCSTDDTHAQFNTSNSNGNGCSNRSGSNSKKNFKSGTLRGLGCAASAQVSVPEAIRASADWHTKAVRKKKQRNGLQQLRKMTSQHQHQEVAMGDNPSSSTAVVPDIWCVPGIGVTASAASVDCVVSRRPAVPVPVSGRGKLDGDRTNQRERERSCNLRRTLNPEHMSLLGLEPAFGRASVESDIFGRESVESDIFGRESVESDIFGAQYYRHVHHPSPEELAEITLFRSGLLMGRRLDDYDRHREWRLDVDTMSYEELLELGDQIGYVNIGLREDEMKHCLKQAKLSILNDSSLQPSTEMELKCSICQEECEADDEIGKLDCGHFYHIYCIKQWLAQKNTCPVCKSMAAAAAAQNGEH